MAMRANALPIRVAVRRADMWARSIRSGAREPATIVSVLFGE
ncbi:MAG TPA: hypothetical protein VFD92_14780 [Candidatus Binatia bacterium]|nr:hypothetical protein [Candidatus Binatia bacterium]